MIDLDYLFWSTPQKWPHDPPEYLFFARAFHEIGTAVYSEGWVKPPNVPEPEPPAEAPDDCDEETWDRYDLLDDQYERECDEAEANCQGMWANVARVIAQACETGALISAVRAKAGGEMIKLEPQHWNTEHFQARFRRCEMSREHPYSVWYARAEACWLYIWRPTLQRHIDGDTLQSLVSSGVTLGDPNTNGNTKKRLGRTPGSGTWEAADDPILEEINRLITSGTAKSPQDAARFFMTKAKGSGSAKSKQARLARRYRKRYLSKGH